MVSVVVGTVWFRVGVMRIEKVDVERRGGRPVFYTHFQDVKVVNQEW